MLYDIIVVDIKVWEKDLKKIPDKEYIKIKKQIKKLAKFPDQGDIKKLSHLQTADYRLRIGNYRVLFDVDTNNKKFYYTGYYIGKTRIVFNIAISSTCKKPQTCYNKPNKYFLTLSPMPPELMESFLRSDVISMLGGFLIVISILVLVLAVFQLMNLWHLITTDSKDFKDGMTGKKKWYYLFFIMPFAGIIPIINFIVGIFSAILIVYYFFAIRTYKKEVSSGTPTE